MPNKSFFTNQPELYAMIPKTILMMMMAALFLGWACQSEQESSIEGTPVSFPPSLREETPAASVVRVSLNEEQMRHLNIRTVAVTPQIIRLPLEMPGTVEPSPERIAVISAPIEGMVVNILAHEGDRVRAGQTLLEIESLEFANLLATYLQAKSTVAFQRSELERVRQLVDKKIAPLRNLEQVTSETERAETALRAAVARLLAVGVTEGQIQAFAANPDAHPHLKVMSPIAGTVIQHMVDRGQAVSAYQRLGTVIDPSQVMIRGYASPEDAGLLSPGDSVRVEMREGQSQGTTTVIHSIIPALDEAHKSITVNLFIDSKDGWPRPGQHVRLIALAPTPNKVIAIPNSAIAYEGDKPTVYVQTGAGSFERREIETGHLAGDRTLVVGGLREGEAVAVNQVFSLKAMSRFSAYGEE